MDLLSKNVTIKNEIEKQFNKDHENLLFERMKYVSYMIMMSYPLFFILDFFLLTDLNKPIYKFILLSLHILLLLAAIIFLLFYRFGKTINKGWITHAYITFYLLVGAASSVNSQLNNGNIYSYIIIVLAIAVVFPLHPRIQARLNIGIHLLFVVGLFLLEINHFSFLIKLVNTSSAVAISFLISYSYYSLRKKTYTNEWKLKKNEESFRTLFHMNPNPLMLFNLKSGHILLLNQQAIEYFQLKQTDLNALTGWFMVNTATEIESIVQSLEAKKSLKNYMVQQDQKWMMLNFELVNYLGEQCVLVGSMDITDLKETEAKLYHHASLDPLTGVFNRRKGMEILSQYLKEGTSAFIVCYIDINNLKMVNDQYGHAAGDELILTCCEIIKRHVKEQDILFRLGGDEFIILFFEQEMDAVRNNWSIIQNEFENKVLTVQNHYPISASHGMYPYIPGEHYSPEEILELADKEMYIEKNKQKRLSNLQSDIPLPL